MAILLHTCSHWHCRTAKKIKNTRIGTPRLDQAPAQPAEPQSIGSTSVSIIATPSPSPTLPESQNEYNNGTTAIDPFPPPKQFDLGDDDIISRMLADDPSCFTLDASFTDVPHGIEWFSLGESGSVDAPVRFVSADPESNEPSQDSVPSATADIASSWSVGNFRSDLNLSYRPVETGSSSANALTSLDASPLQSASNTGAVPQTLTSPTNAPAQILPCSPTSLIPSYPTPSYQDCAPVTNTSSPFGEENLLTGNVWRHPIHTAAQNGHTRIVKLLLQSGCDVDLKDGIGSTPLHVSAAKGHAEVVRLLVNHGSDMNAMNNLGWTPIHLATRDGHTDCVELLLKLGS